MAKKCNASLLASAFKRSGEIDERRRDLYVKQNQIPGTEFDQKEQQYTMAKEDIRLALQQRCDGLDVGNLKCSPAQLKSIIRNSKEISKNFGSIEKRYNEGQLSSKERAMEHNKLISMAEGLIIEGKAQCGIEIYGTAKELLEKGKEIEEI